MQTDVQYNIAEGGTNMVKVVIIVCACMKCVTKSIIICRATSIPDIHGTMTEGPEILGGAISFIVCSTKANGIV